VKRRGAPAKGAPTNIRNEPIGFGRGAHIEIDTPSIPFPEIARELGVPEEEILRWARARKAGRTFASSRWYRAHALEVEKRYGLIDYGLYFSDRKYADGIFENAKRRKPA
jgi:hypothetical protein